MAAQRIALGEYVDVTPRVRVYWPNIVVDDFTDAVNSRVSVEPAHRLIGGIGLALEGWRPLRDGQFSLRAALDLERTYSGTRTNTVVSGEHLFSVSAWDGLRVGLDSTYRQGGFSAGAGLRSTAQFGPDTQTYSGFLKFGVHF